MCIFLEQRCHFHILWILQQKTRLENEQQMGPRGLCNIVRFQPQLMSMSREFVNTFFGTIFLLCFEHVNFLGCTSFGGAEARSSLPQMAVLRLVMDFSPRLGALTRCSAAEARSEKVFQWCSWILYQSLRTDPCPYVVWFIPGFQLA